MTDGQKEYTEDITKAFQVIGNFLIYKHSIEAQTSGDFEFDLDLVPGIWVYISKYKNKKTLKINNSIEGIYFSSTWTDEKKIILEKGLETLLKFSAFTFTEYLHMQCKEIINYRKN